MLSNFRKSLSGDESGQAIILGAVSLLVLAVGIMTTAQLGWAIKERIQLQHAADNAAYTSAAMIARSLNFIAYTNRAIVAQYLTAMALQSLSSYVDSAMVLVAQLGATLLSAAFLVGGAALICLASFVLRPIGAFLQPIAQGLGKAGDAIKKALASIKPIYEGFDWLIALFVKGIKIINHIGSYWIMQQVLGKGFIYQNFGTAALGSKNNIYTETIRYTAGEGVNAGSVGGTGINGYNALMNVIGMVEYTNLFDAEGSERIGNSNNSKAVRAQKMMTQIVNGSRAGTENDSLRWESKRKFGAGAILDAVLGLMGVDVSEWIIDILDKLLPNSEGGTLLAGVSSDATREYLEANTSAEAETDAKRNPVFKKSRYFMGGFDLPSGQLLNSAEFFHTPGDNLPSFIKIAKKYLSAVTGELVPESKIVGIEASKSGGIHCKFEDIVALRDGVCDKLSASTSSKCDGCRETCSEGEMIDYGDGISGECITCEDCKADNSSSGKSAKEACEEAMAAASEVVEGGSSALTGGYPAKVLIACDEEDGIHEFALTPYVSFNITAYEDGQNSTTKEEYPSFWAAAHKNPSFLGNNASALGFGDKYKNTNFEFSSVGVVEGVTARDVGKCNDNFDPKCIENGYNFNHMNNDAKIPGIGAGMHAWARSQVYYHRPGAWAEPPNLFNPYWKAKLSPIAPVLTNKLNALDSLGAIGEFIADGLSSVITTVISH